VTDRDLVIEILAQELSPNTVTAGDIMSYEIVTARDSDSIWTTLQKMRIKGVRRMPVVNQCGGLVGIVTLDDLLELISEELTGLTKIVGRERERERSTRK
jgi:CBS domain-containing protein